MSAEGGGDSGGLGEEEREIVQGLIDTGAVNFEAIGRVLAEVGPRAASLQARAKDYFITIFSKFIRIYVIDIVGRLEDLAALKQMGEALRGES